MLHTHVANTYIHTRVCMITLAVIRFHSLIHSKYSLLYFFTFKMTDPLTDDQKLRFLNHLKPETVCEVFKAFLSYMPRRIKTFSAVSTPTTVLYYEYENLTFSSDITLKGFVDPSSKEEVPWVRFSINNNQFISYWEEDEYRNQGDGHFVLDEKEHEQFQSIIDFAKQFIENKDIFVCILCNARNQISFNFMDDSHMFTVSFYYNKPAYLFTEFWKRKEKQPLKQDA